MQEIIECVYKYGATVVIVALFLWDWIQNRKSINDSLAEMAKANTNTAKSLELLQKSMENQKEVLQEHDKRSIEILTKINDYTKE